MADNERLKLYTSVVPNRVQANIQRNNFNAFIHYGLNTFADKEWSDGTLSPEIFNPSNQDTEQWVKVLKFAGVYGIVFTAKHHDGFCMWQTDTTDYSLKSSPYKEGKGDIVAELAEACKKHGVKLGLYLSPWDRHSEKYGTPEYDDYYVAQLTELLTNYGEIFEVWLDGACAAEKDGKPKQKYDFERYYSVIRKLQPNAVIANCGPDVRWAGNEDGIANPGEWSVIPKIDFATERIISSRADGATAEKTAVYDIDLGNRKTLESYNEFIWCPAEVDVSIRPGWFYHKNQNAFVRNVNNLTYLYYTVWGGNSLLLLNVPPDVAGRINDRDVEKLVRFRDRIDAAFSKPVPIDGATAPEHEAGNKIKNITRYGYDKKNFNASSYYTPLNEADSYEITLRLAKTSKVDKVRLVEEVAFSQRIESFRIEAKVKDGTFKCVYRGKTVGFNRIAYFRPVLTNEVKIVIESSRQKPYIEFIGVYEHVKKGANPVMPISLAIKKKFLKHTGND